MCVRFPFHRGRYFIFRKLFTSYFCVFLAFELDLVEFLECFTNCFKLNLEQKTLTKKTNKTENFNSVTVTCSLKYKISTQVHKYKSNDSNRKRRWQSKRKKNDTRAHRQYICYTKAQRYWYQPPQSETNY